MDTGHYDIADDIAHNDAAPSRTRPSSKEENRQLAIGGCEILVCQCRTESCKGTSDCQWWAGHADATQLQMKIMSEDCLALAFVNAEACTQALYPLGMESCKARIQHTLTKTRALNP